ncbi:MAG: uroporphyrinogen-III synthase [Ilumatobacteraceae bacterium]|jgi:uroporphyrinogen-III synthase|nr:uroporphyrinogen-III synthase [Ilumatobacteraceae bacterium]
MSGRLVGRRIVTTRDAVGELERRLEAEGAVALHLPLIEVVPPDDGGAALRAALDLLVPGDWVVVTSRHGAELVGPAIVGRGLRTAAVGTTTAARLAATSGQPVDVVPEVQRAEALAAALPAGATRVLVAQADIADPGLVEALRRRGAVVEEVTAYRTVARRPDPAQRSLVADADAVLLASGSAARAWPAELPLPPVVVVIGPSTAAAAAAAGVPVHAVAAEHSVAGLVEAVVAALGPAT